jgi:hypothetical protein
MLLYGELLAAALRYRYATHKIFTSSTDINNKTLVVRASCLHKVYFTQSYLLPIYSELLAAALRYRYATHKVFTNSALLIANTPYYKQFNIVLPYQDNDNIFKILCQHLKIKFFAVFLHLR